MVRHKTLKRFLSIVATALLLVGCANRGIGPQGGPKDSIPPIPLFSEPEIGALDYHGNRIEITFNEYIQLNNIASNLMMSPPQQNPPDVKPRGKKLIIQFKDTLHDSTTYTLDFGDAVCDYHEKVPLHGFSFYFSTGPEIDTLAHFGHVYDAETLNPMQGILVGIHRDMSDTAFTRHPFLRIAKTDSVGGFRIGNIHPGKYKIYAVDDIGRDYRLTIGEALAFCNEPITVSADLSPAVHVPHRDSTAVDSLHIDTLLTDTLRLVTLAADSLPTDSIVPDSLLMPLLEPEGPLTALFLFKEAQQKLYLQKMNRDVQHQIKMLFSSAPDSLMTWRVMSPSEIDSTRSDSAWTNPTPYIYPAYSAQGDTVTFWLTDSISIAQDTLFLEARYRITDSVYNLAWHTDTLRAIWRAPRLTAKAKEALDRQNKSRRLELKSNARKSFEMYDTLRVTCATPLAVIPEDSFHLFERIDTVLKPVPFSIAPYDTLPMKLTILADLQPNGEYELMIDSGALYDVYGITHIAASYSLKVKTPADYSTLRVILKPFEPKARIQLLNSKDEVVRELPAVEEGAFFEHLKPDTYYMRLYLDENGDGKWTTGSWEYKRQPERIYYYPDKIQTKSNWDFEQEWDYTAVEQMKSKPRELIKTIKKK